MLFLLTQFVIDVGHQVLIAIFIFISSDLDAASVKKLLVALVTNTVKIIPRRL